jgi:spermidine synthase
VSEPLVIDRRDSPRGELVLRRRGDVFEIISNGVFLMDTSDGRSERLLVHAALDTASAAHRILIGGLGVGLSLRAALDDPRTEAVVVAEIEPGVIDWHRSYLADISDHAMDDPRVEVATSDVLDVVRDDDSSYDLICLDVDNGPGWTVTDSNSALYDDSGTSLLVSRLRVGGALSVWGAAADPAYQELLGRHLDDVRALSVGVARGEPDVVWVGRRGRN